jgi:anti-sigma B factor antagonist
VEFVETVIGVFSSRERAAEAVRELLNGKVPQESIVFLTRSEAEAKGVQSELGTTVGGVAGMAAGIAIALLAVPGIGQVFTLGIGAASLLGLFGASIGSAFNKPASEATATAQPAPDQKLSDDATFFREVLKEGRTLIVVRTESRETAKMASGILDRLGLGIHGPTPRKMQTANRQVGDVTIVDVSGRITLGEGNLMLRDIIRELLEKGNSKILLNLQEVGYVDSSGLGELTKAYTSVRTYGGRLMLVNPSRQVSELLHITRMATVFDVEHDEASAIQSLNRPQGPLPTA